ncbi:MAG: TonB-dependent receptor plug domain-containing protein, partial [Thiovulaceae bacterium]|nr:TonB-dependent receptor plug domain-containing protein [Sulfurimonadaceae bacterium]
MEINFLKRYLRQFILLCCCFVLVSGLSAQDISKLKISVDEKNASIRQILEKVEKTYNIRFFYDEKVINIKSVKTISLNNVNLTKFINVLFDGNATYNTSGNGLVTLVKYEEPLKNQTSVNIQKDTVPQTIPSQKEKTIQVKGKVVDSNNEPLIGAAISVKGSKNKGVTTDIDGNFVIQVDSKAVLNISYIGFKPVDIPVNGQSTISVTLLEDAVTLENIVVTGFQNIQKQNFTGSATKIKSDNLQIKGAVDISRMLEGQVAGVTIQNVSGTFGAAPKVRVRGVTSINGENKPLWVIDGVVHEDIINVTNDQLTSGDPNTLLGSAVAGLNANDIESIDILKDASATALYGARAMNGVIVVTTKNGKEGRPIISYSSKTSIQLKPTYSNYDIMNSAEQMSVYAELERKGFLNSDIINSSNSGVYGKMYKLINTFDENTGKFLLENTQQARENFLMKYAAANTNWFDILFKNSLVQEHSLSISAGSARSRTYASLSYMG